MFSGSSDDFAADVAALREVGVTDTSIGFSARDADELRDAMQRFSEEVMERL